MLLTIYNLPPNTRYQDIKSLLKTKCGLNEIILDNLSGHTQNSKKVTVGLPEEEDAAILVRKINGLYLEGYHLLVEPVKKKFTNTDNMYKNQVMSSFSASSFNLGNNIQLNKQAASSMSSNQPGLRQQPALQQPYYQQASFNMNYQPGFAPNNMQQNQSIPFPYGESNNQNVFANYGYPQQMASQSTSQLMSQPFNNYKHEAPLGFGQQTSSNVWLTNNNPNSSGNASAGINFSQQRNSRWDVCDNNSSRSNRDAPSRDHERNTSSNSFGQDVSARGQVRMRRPPPGSRDFGHNRNNQSERDFRRDSRDHAHNTSSRHRASPIKPAKSFSASAKPSPWQPEIYGKHVTEPSFPLNAPKVPRPSRRRERGNPKQAIKKVLEEQMQPLAKRPRKEASTNLGVFEDKKTKLLEKSPELIPTRAATWRAQLASSLAREIVNNPQNKTDLDPELVFIELKAVIRSRLASLVGTKYDMRMDAMSTLYKSHYKAKSDRELFNKVTGDIKKLKAYHTPVDTDEVKPAASEQPDVKQSAAEDVNEDMEAPPPVDDTEPISLTEGDENAEKYKSLFKDEQAILTQLDQDLAKAIDEELNEMCQQIIEEFNDEPEAKYKNIQEQIKTSALTTLKQVIKVNMAKRFLNIQPVVVRIFVTPKVISKGKLGPILEPEGITSLTKTSNSYIGTCSSYEELDRLCTMKPLVVDGSTIIMKPYHLTGKKQKVDKDAIIKQRQAIADSFTNFALYHLENKLGSKQADEANEQSEENANDGNSDGKTEAASSEESTDPVKTNSAVETENYSDNNQNADQDNPSDATGEQETVDEDENNEVEDSNDQVEENYSQVDENNSQENESPSETPETDTNELKTNENIVNIITEKNKQETGNSNEVNTVHSEKNQHINVPNEEKGSQIKQELNESVQMAEDSDGSIKGGLDQAMKSEDIDNLNRDDYDDIDMADLNEDDLEDW